MPWSPYESTRKRKTTHSSGRASLDCAIDSEDDADDDLIENNGSGPAGPGEPGPAGSLSPPPRKRLQLDHEDVDRFAGMSLASAHRLHAVDPSPSVGVDGTNSIDQGLLAPAPPSTPVSLQTEFAPLPATWEVDPHTTYVNDLSGYSDEEEDLYASPPLNVSDPNQPLLIRDPLRPSRDSPEHTELEGGALVSPTYDINPGLLAMLEAHSRAQVVQQDRRRSQGSQPPSQDEAKGALVLWRGPDSLTRSHDEDEDGRPRSRPITPSPPTSRPDSPMAVFSFGSGGSTPSRGFSPDFGSGRASVDPGDMEVDN
ncbi:unnamed protein product [Parajaminaea phylloscopi]